MTDQSAEAGVAFAGKHARRSVPVFALSGESISNDVFVGSVNAKAGNSREARREKGAMKNGAPR